MPLPLGDERAETRVLPKSIPRQVFFTDGNQFELTLKLREFSNHGPQQSCIVDGCRTNLKHGRRALLGRGSVIVELGSVQNRRGIRANADPGPVLKHPGIYKALAPCVRLASFDTFHFHHASRDSHISVHMHAERLRRNLLLLRTRVRRRRFHTGQKFSLGLDRAIIIHQHNSDRTVPDTCTLNDSGATCCCCAPGSGADDFTLAKNSALVLTEPSSFTSTIPSSRIESSALVSPDLYA